MASAAPFRIYSAGDKTRRADLSADLCGNSGLRDLRMCAARQQLSLQGITSDLAKFRPVRRTHSLNDDLSLRGRAPSVTCQPLILALKRPMIPISYNPSL